MKSQARFFIASMIIFLSGCSGKHLINENNPSALSYPLVFLLNGKDEIVFRSEGYRIGIGEQILKQITNNQ
jgi:hypothetical protein